MDKPIIGILGRIEVARDDYIIGFEKSYVSCDDVEAITLSGGMPLILPVNNDINTINKYIFMVNGILIPGGGDINPLNFGEEPIVKQGLVYDEIDTFDIACIRSAFKNHKPMLGLCRGIQIMNVAFGGTLFQDLTQAKHSYIKHYQQGRKNFQNHTVNFEPETKLFNIFGESLLTNSYHHQAVKDIAPGFKASGFSKDGIIEAIEILSEDFIIGVQWHPEMMLKESKLMLSLFKNFIEASSLTD